MPSTRAGVGGGARVGARSTRARGGVTKPRGTRRKSSDTNKKSDKDEADNVREQLKHKLADFESLVSAQDTQENISQTTLDARAQAIQQIGSSSTPSNEQPHGPAQNIIAHCKSWLAAVDNISIAWAAAVAVDVTATATATAPSNAAVGSLKWKEDRDALAAVIREGARRGQVLLMQAMTPPSSAGLGRREMEFQQQQQQQQQQQLGIQDAGVEALVASVFANIGRGGRGEGDGVVSWGGLVAAQIRGLAEFMAAVGGRV